MPGPVPKDPKIRQRRNKSPSMAVLPAESKPILRRPQLPKLEDVNWLDITQAWWVDVWESPIRSQLIRSDLGSLFRLAVLVNRFFESGSLKIAGEIRLLEREFGLTPMARRRLEWQVAQTEDAQDKREMKRARRAIVIDDSDPREVLDG